MPKYKENTSPYKMKGSPMQRNFPSAFPQTTSVVAPAEQGSDTGIIKMQEALTESMAIKPIDYTVKTKEIKVDKDKDKDDDNGDCPKGYKKNDAGDCVSTRKKKKKDDDDE
jgi:hypothetical protein